MRIHKKACIPRWVHAFFLFTYDLIIDRMTCMKYQSVFLDE